VWGRKVDKNFVSGVTTRFLCHYKAKTRVYFMFPCLTLHQHGGCTEF